MEEGRTSLLVGANRAETAEAGLEGPSGRGEHPSTPRVEERRAEATPPHSGGASLGVGSARI